MKKMRFLLIALFALTLSACTSLLSAEEAPPAARQQQSSGSNRQPAVRDNDQTPPVAEGEKISENEGERKLENTFAGLENGQENSIAEDAPPPAPEATKKPAAAQARNAVCPIPGKPCRHREKEFAEWELPFRLPAKIAPNKTYSSAPFYAVVLKTVNSAEDCDGGEFYVALEDERKAVQQQPDRKVFASYMCPNMDAVDYDFKGRTDASGERVAIENFIAVYAGETEEEAEVLRRSMRDEYPQAVVKRMTARWERIVQ